MGVHPRRVQALRLLQDLALGQVQDGEQDLTQRQLAILLTVYLDPPPHTVRSLAARLGVTKPVVTRALDTMGKLGLMARRRDEGDRRVILVQRTSKGFVYVGRLGELVSTHTRELPPE